MPKAGRVYRSRQEKIEGWTTMENSAHFSRRRLLLGFGIGATAGLDDIGKLVGGIDNDRAGLLTGGIGDFLPVVDRIDAAQIDGRDPVAFIHHGVVHGAIPCGSAALRGRVGGDGGNARARAAGAA
ncbi:MAG: hypothetical protein R3184_12615, partial [Aurantimonas coralicida]|nr:hypothetical protein [Aurantimonas coralicida]